MSWNKATVDYYRDQYSERDLLELALKMLDKAAEDADFLRHNLTREVIRSKLAGSPS